MSNFNDDRYDPNSMDNYMDDLYFDEHYGSSGGGGYRSTGPSSGGEILCWLLGILVIIFGLFVTVGFPPLGVLIILGGYKLMGK